MLALTIELRISDSGPHLAMAARSSIIPSGGIEISFLYLNISTLSLRMEIENGD
jgi:hypothetical protein